MTQKPEGTEGGSFGNFSLIFLFFFFGGGAQMNLKD